ncbi:hypothetical protein U1Q18_002065 [Sarracenia purpurea var. burkii]
MHRTRFAFNQNADKVIIDYIQVRSDEYLHPKETGRMAPPAQGFDSSGEIDRLRALRSNLYGSKSLNNKLRAIDVDSRVKIIFRTQRNGVSRVLGALDLDDYELFLLK